MYGKLPFLILFSLQQFTWILLVIFDEQAYCPLKMEKMDSVIYNCVFNCTD